MAFGSSRMRNMPNEKLERSSMQSTNLTELVALVSDNFWASGRVDQAEIVLKELDSNGPIHNQTYRTNFLQVSATRNSLHCDKLTETSS